MDGLQLADRAQLQRALALPILQRLEDLLVAELLHEVQVVLQNHVGHIVTLSRPLCDVSLVSLLGAHVAEGTPNGWSLRANNNFASATRAQRACKQKRRSAGTGDEHILARPPIPGRRSQLLWIGHKGQPRAGDLQGRGVAPSTHRENDEASAHTALGAVGLPRRHPEAALASGSGAACGGVGGDERQGPDVGDLLELADVQASLRHDAVQILEVSLLAASVRVQAEAVRRQLHVDAQLIHRARHRYT
mmetsp:Transcript_45670/g.146572  ORF Transcript_45670/g.146572 Transcript_45670/m.146572 type:complete len:248 (+) Transcript_45670:593-1336(+)